MDLPVHDEVGAFAAGDVLLDHGAHQTGVGAVVEVEGEVAQRRRLRGQGRGDLVQREPRDLLDQQDAQGLAVVVTGEAADQAPDVRPRQLPPLPLPS
ncbi:hypothetical protein ACWCQK_41990 [Streptomyces sp. NPDC002306]